MRDRTYTLDDRQRVVHDEIHHAPWELHTARPEIEVLTMSDRSAWS